MSTATVLRGEVIDTIREAVDAATAIKIADLLDAKGLLVKEARWAVLYDDPIGGRYACMTMSERRDAETEVARPEYRARAVVGRQLLTSWHEVPNRQLAVEAKAVN